jgi:hypothetical protein
MFLVPAGKSNSSLDKLGELYSKEGDFSKIFVSDEDKAQMSQFLQRDKEAFEVYALRDAVITLKHSISMEQFNLRIKQIGITLTLSSNAIFEG